MQIPKKIRLNTSQQQLELSYADGNTYCLTAELLRVQSPSAEVQGHGQPRLQHGKQNVRMEKIEAAGNYALKITFDDGHDSGLFTWDYLYKLAVNQQQIWQDYLLELEQAGKFRDPHQSVVRLL